MICYKYMSYERFKQSIKPSGVYLKVSRPAEFNDPYDCTGIVGGNASQHLQDTYKNVFRQCFQPVELDLAVKVNGRGMFDGMYRILSLCDHDVSGTPEEMLMWAHYADNARGVRVGIEIDTDRYRLGVVEYEDTLPLLDLPKVKEWKLYDDAEMRRFLSACLLTKHRVWGYEQERRVVFSVNDQSIQPFSLIDAEGPIASAMMVWRPDKAVIREVCLGSEFLQKGNRYEEVESYLSQLLLSGYAFNVYNAARRKGYGYDVLVHKSAPSK